MDLYIGKSIIQPPVFEGANIIQIYCCLNVLNEVFVKQKEDYQIRRKTTKQSDRRFADFLSLNPKASGDVYENFTQGFIQQIDIVPTGH